MLINLNYPRMNTTEPLEFVCCYLHKSFQIYNSYLNRYYWAINWLNFKLFVVLP